MYFTASVTATIKRIARIISTIHITPFRKGVANRLPLESTAPTRSISRIGKFVHYRPVFGCQGSSAIYIKNASPNIQTDGCLPMLF